MSLIGPMYHPGMSLRKKVIEGRSVKIKSGLTELLHSGWKELILNALGKKSC